MREKICVVRECYGVNRRIFLHRIFQLYPELTLALPIIINNEMSLGYANVAYFFQSGNHFYLTNAHLETLIRYFGQK